MDSLSLNFQNPDAEKSTFSLKLLGGTLLFFALYFLMAIQTSFEIATIFWFAIPVVVVGVLYFIKIPGIGIGLMIASTTLDVVGRLSSNTAAFAMTVFKLFFLAFLVTAIFKRLWEKNLKVVRSGIDVELILYFVWVTTTVFWSRDPVDAPLSVIRLASLILTMYLVLNMVENKTDFYLIIILMIVPAMGLSAYASKEFLTASSVEVKNALSMLKLFSRFGATFSNPNYFATFLLYPLCICFAGLAFLNIKFWKKIIYFIIPAALFGVAFVGTFSRSAWIAICFSYLFIFSYFKNKRYWITGFLAVFTVLAIILFQTAFFQSFLLRLTSIFEGKADPSTATRFFLISGGLQMFFNSYFLGVGYESFSVEYLKYMPPGQQLGYVHECHTLPVEILAELGLIGFILVAVIFYKTFKIGIQSIPKIEDNFYRTIQIALVAFLIGLHVNFLFMPGGMLNNFMWINMGLIFGIQKIVNTEKIKTL
ncbi:O-antigen ligase family protein [candidate division KSB1 bacterium]|nr:O-antigen ligase family protein [candidate division KSB1 bacterium]